MQSLIRNIDDNIIFEVSSKNAFEEAIKNELP